MPKLKRKPTRKELLRRDVEVARGLEDRGMDWIKANQQTAVIAALIIVVVIGLFFGVRKWGAYKESQAMSLYGQAHAALDPSPQGLARGLDALKAVADKYPNAKAARYAQLERANLLYMLGRPAEAAKVYEDCATRFKGADDLDTLTKQGLAFSRLSAGDLAGAEKLFQELAGARLGAGTAQLNLGLIYERQGKRAEAVAAYKLAAKQAQGTEASLAKARLDTLGEGLAPGA